MSWFNRRRLNQRMGNLFYGDFHCIEPSFQVDDGFVSLNPSYLTIYYVRPYKINPVSFSMTSKCLSSSCLSLFADFVNSILPAIVFIFSFFFVRISSLMAFM